MLSRRFTLDQPAGRKQRYFHDFVSYAGIHRTVRLCPAADVTMMAWYPLTDRRHTQMVEEIADRSWDNTNQSVVVASPVVAASGPATPAPVAAPVLVPVA